MNKEDENNLLERMHAVEDGLRELKLVINELKEAVGELTVVCSRMNNHISFVEETYEKMKYPLDYMGLVVSRVAGGIRPVLS